MAIIRLQGQEEKASNIYYEFDASSSPLGEGGMGKVYRGFRVDKSTGQQREVAIKFIFDGMAPSVIERARREASIRIKHENLVEMMGFLTTESHISGSNQVQHHYHVVSELLHGVVLSDLLQGIVTDSDGTPNPFAQKLFDLYKNNSYEFAVYVVKNVLSGVMALHDAGYIHRDIDPTNIMVTREGKIKLIDFGIAKQVNNLATQDKALTSTGQFMGKPHYASPELVLGDVAHQNQTTDIYAIGIMMFQLVTGKLPFDGPHSEIIKAQLKKKLPVKLVSNSKFRKVILKATEKSQDKRFQSAAHFRVAVEGLVPKQEPQLPMRNILAALAIIAVLVVVLASFRKCKGGTAVDFIHVEDTLSVKMDTIEALKKNLSNPQSAPNAFTSLQSLSMTGNYAEACYLLSCILRETAKDPLPDEIPPIQDALKTTLHPDNIQAHQLLLRTIELNPHHYKALYELAIDYYRGKERGNTKRDLTLSQDTFNKALKEAEIANDAAYQQKIHTWLNRF